MIDEKKPGGIRMYAHSFIACDAKSGAYFQGVPITLRRGMTVKGRGHRDGGPVNDALLVSRIILMSGVMPWGRQWMGNWRDTAKNGRFEVHGLAADAIVPVFFLDREEVGVRSVAGECPRAGAPRRLEFLRHGEGEARQAGRYAGRQVS